MMKKFLLFTGITIALVVYLTTTVGAVPTSTILQNLFITGIKPSAGTSSLVIQSSGLVTTTTAPGGGGVTTESGWRVNAPFVYLATSTDLVGVGATTTDVKFYVQNTGGGVASTTFRLDGIAGQTGNILTIASSSGSPFWGVANNGQLLASSSFGAGAPAYSFQGDTDIGIYRFGINTIGFSSAGALAWRMGSGVIFEGPDTDSPSLDGSATGATNPAYSFTGDTNLGIYRVGADNLGITTAGTLRWDIDATDVVFTVPSRGGTGSATAPTYSFSGDSNTGIYNIGADILGFTTGGSERMRIDDSGLVQIWDTASSTEIRSPSSTVGTSRVTALTASRLVQTDGVSTLASVSNLASWVAGTTNEITVADDGDGTITLSLPALVDIGAGNQLYAPSTTVATQLVIPSDPVLNNAGEIGYQNASRTLLFFASSSKRVLSDLRWLNISIANGTSSIDSTATKPLWIAPMNLTFETANCINLNQASSSVTFNVVHNYDIRASTNTLWAANQVCNSTTTIQWLATSTASFGNGTSSVKAGEAIWMTRANASTTGVDISLGFSFDE